MFYDFPVRRRFTTPINTKFGGCVLKYQQNTLQESMLMIQNYEVEWYIEQRLKSFFEESMEATSNKEKVIKFLLANPRQVFERIWNNINKKYESMYDKITIKDEDLWKDKIPLSVSTMLICEKYGISWPNDLLTNYTLEQYEWMLEWLRFHFFSQNQKLSVYNKRAMSKKYNESERDKKLMEYARKWPTKEFLDEYYKKNG